NVQLRRLLRSAAEREPWPVLRLALVVQILLSLFGGREVAVLRPVAVDEHETVVGLDKLRVGQFLLIGLALPPMPAVLVHVRPIPLAVARARRAADTALAARVGVLPATVALRVPRSARAAEPTSRSTSVFQVEWLCVLLPPIPASPSGDPNPYAP